MAAPLSPRHWLSFVIFVTGVSAALLAGLLRPSPAPKGPAPQIANLPPLPPLPGQQPSEETGLRPSGIASAPPQGAPENGPASPSPDSAAEVPAAQAEPDLPRVLDSLPEGPAARLLRGEVGPPAPAFGVPPAPAGDQVVWPNDDSDEETGPPLVFTDDELNHPDAPAPPEPAAEPLGIGLASDDDSDDSSDEGRALPGYQPKRRIPEEEETVDPELELACARHQALAQLRLTARREALATTLQILADERSRTEDLAAQIRLDWHLSRESLHFAENLGAAATAWCDPAAPLPPGSLLSMGRGNREMRERIAPVVHLFKNMKPKAAAKILDLWPPPMAAAVLDELAPRVAAPIATAMASERAARLTRDIAAGATLTR